jgi:hypothetical protein
MFVRVFCATAFLVLLAGTISSEEPNYEKLKERWAKEAKEIHELREKSRLAEIDMNVGKLNAKNKELAKEAKDLKSTVGKKKAQIVADNSKASTVERKIEINEGEIKRLLATKKPRTEDYAIDPRDLKEGSFGILGANESKSVPPRFRVLQIQDRTNALMTWGKKTYWMQIETKGLTDGDEVQIRDYVHCLGTKTYNSLTGKNTVLELRVVK